MLRKLFNNAGMAQQHQPVSLERKQSADYNTSPPRHNAAEFTFDNKYLDQLQVWISSSPCDDDDASLDRSLEDLCALVTTELIGPEFSVQDESSKLCANPLHRPVCSRVRAHLQSLPQWYRVNTAVKEIAHHIRVLLRAKSEDIVVSLLPTHSQQDEERVVVICARDRRQLLDAITRCLSARASIKEATIVTTGDGFALDRFVLQFPPDYQFIISFPLEWEQALKHEIDSILQHAITSTLTTNTKLVAAPSLEVEAKHKIHFQQIRLMRALGEGRSGKTFVAQYHGKLVAAKVISTTSGGGGLDYDNGALSQFTRELHFVAKLKHPNICNFIGATSRPPKYILLFELCEGDLWWLLKQKQRKFSAMQVMLDIAHGLEYLHSNSILHRDVKPENLMLDANLNVKVADFGLSCYFTAKPRELSSETGTYRYMAPEVLRHELYSTPVDVYSFAVVCYVVLSRKVPFEQWTPLQTAMAVAHQHARPRLSGLGLPRDLEQLITQCWHPMAASRPNFTTVTASLEHIRAALTTNKANKFDREGKT